ASLSDYACDQFWWRHVKCRVEDPHFLWCNPLTAHLDYLVNRPFLNNDILGAALKVKRRERGRYIERNLVFVCKDCHLICANLVEDVARSKHPVCADNDALYRTPCHHVTNGSVGYQTNIDSVMLELKSS